MLNPAVAHAKAPSLPEEFQGVVEVIWLTHRAIRMLRKSLCFFFASWREHLPELGLP